MSTGSGAPGRNAMSAAPSSMGSGASSAPAMGATPTATPQASQTPSTQTPPRVASTPAAIAAPSAHKATPRYQPQFTAATQMILKKMKGEPVSLSSALSSSFINPTAFEAAKSRMRESLNTSTTPHTPHSQSLGASLLRMPTPAPSAAGPRASHIHARQVQHVPGSFSARASTPAGSSRPVPGAHMSAIQRINAGLTPSGKLRPEPKPRAANGAATISTTKKTKTQTSTKRKRGRGANDSDSDESESDDASAPTTMTKSGRQVTKPTTYNPAEMDDSHKRARGTHFGTRTAEQAMCRRCSRLAFNDDNQIVFCDGCEGAWHQHCHQPRIGADVVGDVQAKWYCAGCAAKRDKRGDHKRVKVEEKPTKTSWASRTNGQKRAFLSNLPTTDLVEMIMGILEQQPNLAIFPSEDVLAASSNGMPRSFFAGTSTDGLFSRSEANPMSTLNYIRKISANAATNSSNCSPRPAAKRNGTGIPTRFEFTPFDSVSEDTTGLMDAWPKPGEGSAYDKLVPEDLAEGLVDSYDDEVVRHTVWKNGVAQPVGRRDAEGQNGVAQHVGSRDVEGRSVGR